RRLLFIAFTAEERGLLGSNFYVNDPLVPLANTVAMLNFDMIGHLEDGPLTLLGIQSANSFSKMIERLDENKTFAVESRRVRGESDHMRFQRKRVPYLFFHTGVTPTYHTPDDDFHTLDIAGTVAVIDFAEEVLDGLLKMPTRPEFTGMKAASEPRRAEAYLGIVPDHSGEDHGGVKCMQINPGSPADEGKLEQGDIIVKLAATEVRDKQGLVTSLRKCKPGDRVEVVIRRDKQKKILHVTLGTLGR
ncbi:MAG: M28 family peptidase, partial [Pirellulaceae bacterium]